MYFELNGFVVRGKANEIVLLLHSEYEDVKVRRFMARTTTETVRPDEEDVTCLDNPENAKWICLSGQVQD